MVETAVQSLASTKDARAIADAAYAVLGSGSQHLSMPAKGGRWLLRQAVTSSITGVEAMEPLLFVGVGGLPHPAPVRAACEGLAIVAVGGWAWAAAEHRTEPCGVAWRPDG